MRETVTDKTARRKLFFRVLRLVRPYSLLLALSLIAAVISVLGQLYIPILTSRVIDDMLGAGQVSFPGIRQSLIGILLFAALASMGQWVLGVSNNRMVYTISRSMRNAALRKIQRLPLSYLDRHPAGDLVSRVISDVDLFTDGLLVGFTQFFTGLLTIGGTMGFMLSVNVPVALVVLCVTPLSLLAATFVAKKSYTYFNEQSRLRGEQTAFINERVEGTQVVQAFSREKENLRDFDALNNPLCRTTLRAVFYSSISNPVTRFVNGVVYAGVGLAGSLAAVAGGITVGSLSCFLTYANQYTKPFNEISGVVAEMQNALACAARIFDLMDQPEEIADAPDARVLAAEEITGQVELKEVFFSYDPNKPLIENFSLNAAPGSKVAIVGPTGCGKTTLINLLMRFYDVNKGEIRVSDVNIADLTRHSLRRSYGMVLQETWLMAGSIAENIAYGRPQSTREEVEAAARAAHAHGFICRLPEGYDTLIGEDGAGLSQGQKQLLCIARVMLCLPPLLILDEATSSIDTRTELRIQEAFSVMTQGRTSFIVAHRLSTVREADNILVMREGKIVESGTHDQLLKRGGFYAMLYNSQFEGIAI